MQRATSKMPHGVAKARPEGPAKRTAELRSALLSWFDENRRPLPWRKTRDPYRIWVAEVMLQQTRIAVVVPAYRRFVAAFPDVASLARASQEEVLSSWSGLGYYGRARSLHRAAQALVAADETTFPRDPRDARALPGVGSYTAAAVLSIAYGEPLAAVDGNVVRVLARLERIAARPDGRGEPYRSIAERLLCRRRPGDWNQALMELGETVCTPAAPRCAVCPLARWCRAHRDGAVALHPPPRRRRARESIPVEMTLLCDRAGRILLERGAFPYLSHLWLPPARVRKDAAASRTNGRGGHADFKHTILHRELHVRVARRVLATAALRRSTRAPAAGIERRLFTRTELAAIGRAALLTKALAAAGGVP
jgi:A/G-specific adenine glycosylase